LTVSDNPIDSFKLFLTIINTIVITLTLFIFTLRMQHDTYITVTVPMKTYDKCVTENMPHLPLPCRDRRNMSVCGDVLLNHNCIYYCQEKFEARGHSIDDFYQVSVVAIFANRSGRNKQS
jgi:hypothetical protein